MSYHQDSLKRTKKIKFFSLLVIGIIFYFSSNFIIGFGYRSLSFITLPIWRFKSSLSGTLDVDLNSTRLESRSLSLLKQENKELLIELGRQVPIGSKSIIAAVLSGPNIPPYENLIIDAGSLQGVEVGNRVIYKPNIVIGEIGQVAVHSSKVKLYSGSGMRTDVLIPTDEPIHAVANGFGGGNFFLELPSSIPLSTGMELLIPGSDIYILGVIDYIQVDPITSSQKVLIRYPINIKSARFVHVIKSSDNEYLE